MSSNLTTKQIIDSALELPLEERERIVDVLQQSLFDNSIDHGPEDPADEVESAWSEEIARRIDDIDSGRVKLVSAEEPERIIRGDVRPSF